MNMMDDAQDARRIHSNARRCLKKLKDGCPCSPAGIVASPWAWGHVAMVMGAFYQQVATRDLPPLSDFLWRFQPALLLGLLFHAIVHCTVGKWHPQQAASLSCYTLMVIAAHRYCAAIMTPADILQEELQHFQFSAMSGSIILCACGGAVLGWHSEIYSTLRYVTLIVFNSAYLARGLKLYSRTGSRHREYVQFTLLCICLPYCVSFLVGRLLCPRPGGLHGRRRAHPATRLHVDSACQECLDNFAYIVFRPCGLGLCPDCLAHFYPNLRRRRENSEPMSMTCPQCHETVSHWVRIRHCDLEDEKAV